MYESVSESDNAGAAAEAASSADMVVERLVPRLVELLGSGRAGLVTDIDGTVSPTVARPEEALVLPRARAALLGLKDMLQTVAVVTGRGVEDARAMVRIEEGVEYIGNHGLEVWDPISRSARFMPEARPWAPRLAGVLEQITRLLPHHDDDGIIVENKGVTGSLHYRMARDPKHARRELLEILARSALTSGLRVEEGRMVINVLPPLRVSKGSAVTWLVREHRLDRIVYFGDDLTDAHAFKALLVLRHSGAVRALGVGVVGPETPLSVKQLADASLPTVEAVADVLCQLLTHLCGHMPRTEC